MLLNSIIKMIWWQALFTLAIALLLATDVLPAQDREIYETPGELTDPLRDPVNMNVKVQSISALFMNLELVGDSVVVRDLRITRIPLIRADFSEDHSKIVIEVFNRNGNLVGRTSVSDRRMVARDGDTLILNERSVSVVAPLLARPSEVSVNVPGAERSQELSVESVTLDYCTDFAESTICTTESPDSHPQFDLLRRQEP